MPHYRNIVVDGTQHKYNVGRQHLHIRGIGTFYYTNYPGEVSVRPSDIEKIIRRNLKNGPASQVRKCVKR
jgi:hypothetical protein